MKTISREQIQARLAQQHATVIVEALPPRYYQDGHLPGAINIPHDEVESKAATLVPNKDSFVVVYCANTPCPNSKIAAHTFTKLGYQQVYEYVEGKQDWAEAGFELEVTAMTKAE
ncbi:MAG: rhodanese-like domain-containing protein [Gammaproteobacteria bacterium]|nr:rhodanese-like domain-containing protein [Gammaproteobacteria bacterium]MDH5800591.1 rhodanese-like domain-containing protein [Gammaproteobacteria bacterium]